MPVKLDTETMKRLNAGVINPKQAFAEQEAKNAAAALLALPAMPRLCAYTPWSATRNLGAEYNRIMARLDPDEWAIFLDHDALIVSDALWSLFGQAIRNHPDAGAITCYTNRTANPAQKAKAPSGDNIPDHAARARQLLLENQERCTDITAPRMTGMCFATSKAAWEKAGPFADGMGEVDNKYAAALVAAGLKIWRVDGAYVWHEKRSSGPGKVKPTVGAPHAEDCHTVAVTWTKAAPVIHREATGKAREDIRGHEEKIDSHPEWSGCQKAARHRVALKRWREEMRVSVVIPSREEDPHELAGTVATFKDAGAHEVIVIDDATREPVGDCGADLLIRHETAAGVAASRNEGLARASGNVIGYSDSHCRIAAGDFMAWCFEAFTSDDLLSAAVGGYGSPSRVAYGCNLPWQGWYFNVDPNATTPRTTAPAPYGSVYCAARWTWDRIGGWVPTCAWGFNEQALGLACHHAGVTVRVTPEFKVLHKYRVKRARKSGPFPYPSDHHNLWANAAMVQRLIFSEEIWEDIFLPAMQRHMPHAERWMSNRWNDAEFGELKARYAGLKRASDEEIFAKIGALHLIGAQATPGREPPPREYIPRSGMPRGPVPAQLTPPAITEAAPPQQEPATDANDDR